MVYRLIVLSSLSAWLLLFGVQADEVIVNLKHFSSSDYQLSLAATLNLNSVNVDEVEYQKLLQRYRILPGSDFVGVGYDASKSYGTYENARHPLFRKTFDHNSEIFNDFVVPKNINVRPIWDTLAETKAFNSEKEFMESLSVRVSADASGGNCFMSGGGGMSTEKSSSSSYLESSKLVVFEVRVEMFEMNLDTAQFEKAEPDFADAIVWLQMQLNKVTDQTKSTSSVTQLVYLYPAFHAFFQQFGTHYVHSATMGGNLFAEAKVAKTESTTNEKLEIEASAYFSSMWGSVRGNGGTEKDQKAETFSSTSSVNFRCIGGDPLAAMMVNQGPYMANSFRFWLSTITSKPNVARFQLKTISHLLPMDSFGPLATLMTLASDLYLSHVPPRGNNFFEVSKFQPPVWSSTNMFLDPGRGSVGFYALVHDAFHIHLSAVPQYPLLTITFGVEKCFYRLHTTATDSVTGMLNLYVPYGFYQITLENGHLTVAVADSRHETTQTRTVSRHLGLYRNILDRVQYIGFSSNQGSTQFKNSMKNRLATSFVALSISQSDAPQKRLFSTCADLKLDKPVEHYPDDFYIIDVFGKELSVYCYKMTSSEPKMYLELSSGIGFAMKQNQIMESSIFRFVRFLPEFMIVDLCDTLQFDENMKLNEDTSAARPGTLSWLPFTENFASSSVSDNLNAHLRFDSSVSIDFHANQLYLSGKVDLDNIYLDTSTESAVAITISRNGISDAKQGADIWFGNRMLSYSVPNLSVCPLAFNSGTVIDKHKALRIQIGSSLNFTHIWNDLKMIDDQDPPNPLSCPGGQNVFSIPAAEHLGDDMGRLQALPMNGHVKLLMPQVNIKKDDTSESVPPESLYQTDVVYQPSASQIEQMQPPVTEPVEATASADFNGAIRSSIVTETSFSLAYNVELPFTSRYSISLKCNLSYGVKACPSAEVQFFRKDSISMVPLCSIDGPLSESSCVTSATLPCGSMQLIMHLKVTIESLKGLSMILEAVHFAVHVID